ncbi:caveolae-associated protein 2b [Nothobranchius furzeri]|uniref:Serum deprivation-response protein-like n=2 Tax=Nothobranchius TaxID=28779 RepID=A0A9D2Y5Q5_NOTFU|nr:caveolae-associated protein 2b [Nothobranchius furzeri]KAF7214681.1 serum deprivation-response protein-like [Nothobranchius furzeri]
MVTTESPQSQDLMVPHEIPDQLQNQEQQEEEQASPSSVSAGLDLDKFSQGPVNAITVLTLLDKLVNMLDVVQENQLKTELHQVEMEGVVRGIQADMTKLSKSHSHTSNTVSKLLGQSRKLSATMKEVRARMERQDAQVKKLEANHAHLISRDNFKVLIFQEENEIPSTVFVKNPPPFPRDEILEEGEDSVPGVSDDKQELGFHTIDLSSDEDVGLEPDLEEDEAWSYDLGNCEETTAEKLKRSSLMRVESLKKAFSKQNIEKKMTKFGTKIVSEEQREKIKQKTASLKVSPLKFGIKKPRSSSDSQPPEASGQTNELSSTETNIQVPTTQGSIVQEVTFTEVHAELAPAEQVNDEGAEKEIKEEEEKKEKEGVIEGSVVVEAEVSLVSEGVNEEYALSSTLPQEDRGAEEEKKDHES